MNFMEYWWLIKVAHGKLKLPHSHSKFYLSSKESTYHLKSDFYFTSNDFLLWPYFSYEKNNNYFKLYLFYKKEKSFCTGGGLFVWVHFPVGCAPFHTQRNGCPAQNNYLLTNPLDRPELL